MLKSPGVVDNSLTANFGRTEAETRESPGPVTANQQTQQESGREEARGEPFLPQQTINPTESGFAGMGEQLSTDEEAIVSALIADMVGVRTTPIQPRFVEMVRQFVLEGVDLDWSIPTENQIFNTIAVVPDIAAANIQVECRTTLCRLRIVHPPSDPTGPVMTGATIIEIMERSSLTALWFGATQDEFGNPISHAYLKKGERDTAQSINFTLMDSLQVGYWPYRHGENAGGRLILSAVRARTAMQFVGRRRDLTGDPFLPAERGGKIRSFIASISQC